MKQLSSFQVAAALSVSSSLPLNLSVERTAYGVRSPLRYDAGR
jgi:hypothetical protein